MKIRLLCCFLLACQWCFAATEKTIYSFSEFSHGESPFTNVTVDSAGNIYGTTCFGGAHNDGTVFKLTPGKNGSYTQTVLYSFSGSDGACPKSGVVLDSAGNIYGTASTGGNKSTTCFQTSGCGLVFKLSPNGNTWKQQVLYKFSGSDASYPSSLMWYQGGSLVGTAGPPSPNWDSVVFMLTPSGTAWNFTTLFSFPATGFSNGVVGPLVVDSSGNFYGVTTYGGTYSRGIVFELSYSGNNLVETVLHVFGSTTGDGMWPMAGLVMDQAGNLYGSFGMDGTLGYGGIFKLTRDTQNNWNYAQIYDFKSVTDGWGPQGGVVLDGAGNVYGTTAAGGSTSCSCGTAFELSPNSSGTYTKKTIHNFSGYAGSQLGTLAAMVFDSQGNLYGTTPDGNGKLNVSDRGTVYRLSPGSSGWPYTVLYGFPASDGHGPDASPTFDSAGNLYGTTSSGGSTEAGTVYELSPGNNGVWTEKLLYAFRGGSDGATPYSNIVIDSSGNLFGTTRNGGGASSGGSGTVFELSPNGTGWKETILHAFQSNGTDGTWPLVGLTRDASGNLFGTTYAGGTYGFGTVFKMTLSSGTWSESVLYSFTGGADGSQPYAPITIDSAGNLYGSTIYGGAHGTGAIFALSPKSDGNYAESVLYSFTGSSDGDDPRGSLTLDAAGNLYGVAAQVAFELSPSSSGSWTETVLYTFGKNGDLSYPGGLAFDASGNLWGTAGSGGASKDGGVFELSPSGGQWKENQSIVFSGLLGISPTGNVIFDGAGNLYGVGFKGGKTGDGVVFEITP